MLITQFNTRQQQVEGHFQKKGTEMTNYLKAETLFGTDVEPAGS